MKRILIKTLATVLLLSLMLGMGTLVLQGETFRDFSAVTSLTSGEYVLLIHFSSGSFYLPHTTVGLPDYPGLEVAVYDKTKTESLPKWKIERVSDTKCTLQNVSLGENGYLNLSSTGAVTFGKRQEINYQFSGNTCKFYITSGGTNYYVRLTNQNVRRFHAGTADGSNGFTLCRYVEYQMASADNSKIPAPSGEPILTIACVTDLHTDWQLQSKSPYVRPSLHRTLTRIAEREDADVFLSGGDNTSDNARQSEYAWPKKVFDRVLGQYDSYAQAIAPYQLWACGNHDHEVGEDEGYDAYADYETIMKDSNGEPVSVYRQKDDKSLSDQRYPHHIMGLHYRIEGFDFIVLNPPYSKSLTYSSGTYQWLEQRLKAIGPEKTVFFLTHYPLADHRGPSAAGSGTKGNDQAKLKEIFASYPNLIYLYGHTHGGDGTYIREDTFEQVTSFSPIGTAVNDRNLIPQGFISSFMGSMSYSKNDVITTYLNEKDAPITQALMIYVYADRIVFHTKNFGDHPSNATKVLDSWTVLRDLSAYASPSGGQTPPVTDTATDSSTDSGPASGTVTDSASSDSSGPASDSSGASDLPKTDSASESDPTPSEPSSSLSPAENGSQTLLWVLLILLLAACGAVGAVIFLLLKNNSPKSKKGDDHL